MRIKDGLTVRRVGRQYMIVDEGDSLNEANVYTLNSTAAYLWENVVGTDFDNEVLAELICQKYDVEKNDVMGDVVALVEEWTKLGLVKN